MRRFASYVVTRVASDIANSMRQSLKEHRCLRMVGGQQQLFWNKSTDFYVWLTLDYWYFEHPINFVSLESVGRH